VCEGGGVRVREVVVCGKLTAGGCPAKKSGGSADGECGPPAAAGGPMAWSHAAGAENGGPGSGRGRLAAGPAAAEGESARRHSPRPSSPSESSRSLGPTAGWARMQAMICGGGGGGGRGAGLSCHSSSRGM
jgi:hypothetical protein